MNYREHFTAGRLKTSISFIDTEKLMSDEDQETSKLNRGEAGCILFLVKKLIREGVPARDERTRVFVFVRIRVRSIRVRVLYVSLYTCSCSFIPDFDPSGL